jgi:hypothetical protein
MKTLLCAVIFRCIWENRIQSRWIALLHNTDNFALPVNPEHSVPQALARYDPENVAEIRVPMCGGGVQAPSKWNDEQLEPNWSNTLYRWPLLLPCIVGKLQTPYGNPRLIAFSNIHHLIRYTESLSTLIPDHKANETLTTFHVKAMTRRFENDWQHGARDPRLKKNADLLALALRPYETPYANHTKQQHFQTHRSPDRCNNTILHKK